MQAAPSSQPSLFVPLDIKDWVLNGKKRYFRCRALRLPGSKVVGVTAAGEACIKKDAYKIKGSRLYWIAGVPPDDLYVELRMKRRPFSWREMFLAVTLALVVGALGARQTTFSRVITQGAAYVEGFFGAIVPSSMAAERSENAKAPLRTSEAGPSKNQSSG
jgi:hypothetical protein